MLTRAIRRLHPAEASRCPALFMTEIVAALLSVLALHDHILASPAVSLEAIAAGGSWGLLILLACGLAIRDR
jgi:hypothetical protein